MWEAAVFTDTGCLRIKKGEKGEGKLFSPYIANDSILLLWEKLMLLYIRVVEKTQLTLILYVRK